MAPAESRKDDLPHDTTPPVDTFYSPANHSFYDDQPYDTLSKESRMIRLLKVRKNEAGHLECVLTQGIPLAEADNTYTALSYCAGDPNKTQTVTVSGRKFNAFANLGVALEQSYHYRTRVHKDVEVLIWADQICIDQSNPLERSHQVSLMYEIYSCSREVVVCLFTGDEPGGIAIDWIQEVHASFPKLAGLLHVLGDPDILLKHQMQPTLDGVSDMIKLSAKFRKYMWSKLKNETFVSGWLDVLQMLGQPWWGRSWVLQEYVAARDAHYLYGGRCIHWKILSAVVLMLLFAENATMDLEFFLTVNRKHNRSSQEYRQLSQIKVKAEALKKNQMSTRSVLGYKCCSAQRRDLRELLNHSRTCGASDKRDHVFAFLGLTDSAYGIEPNYSPEISVESLFIELSCRIVQHDGDLRLLSQVSVGRDHLHERGSRKLPSWVPDWTSPRISVNRGFSDMMAHPDVPYSACGYAKADVTFSDDGRTLEVSGIYLDGLVTDTNDEQTRRSTKPYRHGLETWKGYHVETACAAVQDNDQLWILYGAKRPCILRCDGPCFNFVGDGHLWFPQTFIPDDTSTEIMNGAFARSVAHTGGTTRVRIR